MISRNQTELKESIKQISVRRREWDDLFSDLQGLLKGKVTKLPVARVRVEFQQRVEKLKEVVRTQTEELQKLRYRAERMKTQARSNNSQGNDMESTLRNLQALQEYFRELGRKVKEQQGKGEQEIAQRERWEVAQNDHQGLEEQSQLIMSSNAAREVRESAQFVLGNLENQGSRLQQAKEKMTSVLRNINLSGNIVNLLKRRSRDDNRLIMWLTLGLVVQIFLCLYYIRPFFKGY